MKLWGVGFACVGVCEERSNRRWQRDVTRGVWARGMLAFFLTVFSKCTGCKTHKTQEQGREGDNARARGTIANRQFSIELTLTPYYPYRVTHKLMIFSRA